MIGIDLKMIYKFGFLILLVGTIANTGYFIMTFQNYMLIRNIGSSMGLLFQGVMCYLFYYLWRNADAGLDMGKELNEEEIKSYFENGV